MEGGSEAARAAVYGFGEGEELRRVSFTAGAAGTEYALYWAPVAEGVPSADRGEWTPLSDGVLECTGYHTVTLDPPFPLPAGAGALVLTLKGDDLVIGTDENMTKENGKPMFFSQVSDNGSFLMTENGFEKAQRTRLYNGEEHIEGFDVCLRAYTASSGNE